MMKNTLRVLMVTALTVMLTFSCNLVLPEKLEVTGSPSYEVSAGSANVDITKYFDIEQVLQDSMASAFSDPGDSFSSGDEGGVYTIFANKRLISQPLGDLLTQDIGLADLNQTITPINFTVPDVGQTQNYVQTINSVSSVAMPALPSQTGIPELDGTDTLTVTIPTDFTTLTLNAGVLSITVTPANASPSLTLSITGARLLNKSDVLIANTSTTVPLNATSGGTVDFNLAGTVLQDELKLELDIAVSGAVEFELFDIAFSAGFSGLDIAAATGVDFTQNASGTESISLSLPAEFVSAAIGSGSLAITIGAPAGWTGVSDSFSATLQIGSQTPLSGTRVGDVYTINLASAAIEAGDPVTLDYSMDVTGTNAGVSFPADYALDAVLAISEFSSLVINAPDLDFSYTEPFVVPQEVIDKIDIVTFTEPKLQFTITNQLPSDLTISLSSTVLGTPVDLVFPSQSDPTLASFPLSGSIDFNTGLYDIDGTNKGIDINLGVTLNGFDPNTDNLTLGNVIPGTTYSFSGSFELILDLATVDLKPIDFPGTFPESGGDPLDFSMIGDFLPVGVNLSSGISSTLNLTSGMDLTGMTLGFVVLARYDDGAGGYTYVDLLNDTATPTESDFLSPDLYTAIEPTDNQLELFLVNLVSARAAGIEIAYHVAIDGVVDLTTAPSDASLDAIMQLTLPLELEVEEIADGGVLWNFDEFTPTEDLFGREPGDTSMDELFNNLAAIRLNYDLINEVIVASSDIYLRIFQDGFDGTSFTMNIKLSTTNGIYSVGFTESDLEFIKTHDFMPHIGIFLPAGTVFIDPEGALSIGLSVTVDTDIHYEFAFGGEGSNE